MSIYCPVLEHKVTYIHCQDCDKECTQNAAAQNTAANDDNKFYCLIVGSRTFNNYELLKTKVNELLVNNIGKREIHIVSGGANGADSLAERYAHEYGYQLHVFEADWSFGKAGGYSRNRKMHEFISQFPHRGCVAFWDGKSRGTAHNFGLSEEYDNNLRIVRF